MSLPNFLRDRKFLTDLDNLSIKQQFLKITILNWQEEPLKEVQGRVISGSINLDGSSSMRRTGTLSIYAEESDNDLTNLNSLFAINKKCKIEIGIKNTVPSYTYSYINENTKLMNFVTVDYKEKYGQIVWFPLGLFVMFNPSITNDLNGINISMNLKDKMCLLNGDVGGQIHSSVEFTAQDEKVDINSVSLEKNPTLIYNLIKELVNHWGNEKLENIIISEVPLRIKQVVKWNLQGSSVWLANTTSGYQLFLQKPTEYIGNEPIQFKYGQDMGYIYTDFVYPGTLECNIGDTITSVLDKIIQVIGNYEYFYDVEGRFIFREKQNSLNMSNTAYWLKTENDKLGNLPSDVYDADFYRLTKSVYNFTGNRIVINNSNSLNYSNVKNDFVVWGFRKGLDSNTTIPCRYHLAIDKKPDLHEHTIILFTDDSQTVRAVAAKAGDKNTETRTSVDWREEIYYQMLEDEKFGTGQNTELNNTYFQYYAELKEEFPKIFDLKEQKWKYDYKTSPENVNYFLDFIDENTQLGKYSVNNIGRRAKIVGDGNQGINCVFEPIIPDIVYLNADEYDTQSEYTKEVRNLINYGQIFTQVSNFFYSYFVIGGVLNSCFEKIKDLLYQYTHVNNTISFNYLPIYYLEPNTRITIDDPNASIYGDYIIQSISLPLDISSTMSISAYKALQKI